MKKGLLLIILAITLTCPISSFALSFDPNNIISDYDMQNSDSMTQADIQSFLDSKGYLGEMLFENFFGELSPTSEIIYKYAKQFKISPKYLITVLQKEQSLVESPAEKITQSALNWAMGYGVCDSCDKNDPLIQKFKGFDNQIYNAAKKNRDYFDNPKNFKIQVGKEYKIDGQIIIPTNQATVNLYTYTPHLKGNQNFFNIWNNYFTKYYPDGTLLAEKGKPGIWLIQDGLRRPFMNSSAFYSRYDSKNIIYTFKTDLEKYEIGKPIKFSNYSIFKTKENGNIYLLQNETLRRISSMKIFKNIGFNPAEIATVSLNDIGDYDIGEDINETSIYPTGAILQNKETKEMWYIQDGIKHLIAGKAILAKYKGKAIIQTTSQELDQYEQGDDDKLQNGTIITTSDKSPMFIISNGERREIQTTNLFNDLGFKKENIIKVTDNELVVHPLGFPLEKTF